MVWTVPVSGIQEQMAYRVMGKTTGRGGESGGHRFHRRGKQRAGNIKISNNGTHFITHYLCIPICTEIFRAGYDNGSGEGIGASRKGRLV